VVRQPNKRIKMQLKKIYSKYKLRVRKRISPRKLIKRAAIIHLFQKKEKKVRTNRRRMKSFSIWMKLWVLLPKSLSRQKGIHGQINRLLAVTIPESSQRNSVLNSIQNRVKSNSQSLRLKNYSPKTPKIYILNSKNKIYLKL
jgi:hypothetical protein